MKRFYFGVVLMLVLLVMSVSLTFCFHRIHAPLADTLVNAAHQALEGNWEQAKELALDARVRWDTYRDFTAAVADHEPMEEMEGLFYQLEVYTNLDLQGQFAAICVQLSQMAAAMEESQILAWWTLL